MKTLNYCQSIFCVNSLKPNLFLSFPHLIRLFSVPYACIAVTDTIGPNITQRCEYMSTGSRW